MRLKSTISALALTALCVASPIVLAADDPPPQLANQAYVYEIEEHLVVISALSKYKRDPESKANIGEWANWACSLYKRYAVGPLSAQHGDHLGGDFKSYYWYACAIR